MPAASPVTVNLYNSNGQPVQHVTNGATPGAGQHELPVDATILACGTYFCEVQTSAGSKTTHMQVVH